MSFEAPIRSAKHMSRFGPPSPKRAASKRLSKGTTCTKSPAPTEDFRDLQQSPRRNVRKSPFSVSATTPLRKLRSGAHDVTSSPRPQQPRNLQTGSGLERKPTSRRPPSIQNSPRTTSQRDRHQDRSVESPPSQSQGRSTRLQYPSDASPRSPKETSPLPSRSALYPRGDRTAIPNSTAQEKRCGCDMPSPLPETEERCGSSWRFGSLVSPSGSRAELVSDQEQQTATCPPAPFTPIRRKASLVIDTVSSLSPISSRGFSRTASSSLSGTISSLGSACSMTSTTASSSEIPQRQVSKPALIYTPSQASSCVPQYAYQQTRCRFPQNTQLSSKQTDFPSSDESVQSGAKTKPQSGAEAKPARILNCAGSFSVPQGNSISAQNEIRAQSARILSCAGSFSVPHFNSISAQNDIRAQSARILSCSSSVSAPSCSSASVQKKTRIDSARIFTSSVSVSIPPGLSQQLSRQSSLPSKPTSSLQGLGQSPELSETDCGGLIVEELQISNETFDLKSPSFRGILLEKLGLQASATIRQLQKLHGGLNLGIYTVQDGSRTLILKMVTSTRYMGIPTEAESLVSLSKRVPSISHDRDVAFPIGVFLLTTTSQASRNLIVMEKVAGQPLADIIIRKLHTDSCQDLKGILHQFGTFLAAFHKRYGMQHCDCQPGNIFYDESSARFSLIDISELGSRFVKKLDVDHFCDGLVGLMRHYGRQLCDECCLVFKKGYSDDVRSNA